MMPNRSDHRFLVILYPNKSICKCLLKPAYSLRFWPVLFAQAGAECKINNDKPFRSNADHNGDKQVHMLKKAQPGSTLDDGYI